MRSTLFAALLASLAAATALAEDRVTVVEFTGAAATKSGGEVTDTRYSEKADDAVIQGREFADGVVTYAGQVGMGKGSAWAGIGFSVNIQPQGKPMDASRFRSVTFLLAAAPEGSLRLRVIGAEEKIRSAGCYPIVMQTVGKDVREFTVPLAKFSSEGWCAGNARDVKKVLAELVGFEIVDVNMRKAPASLSVGSITLNP